MKLPRSLCSLPPAGTECPGSRSACADLDGSKASRLWRLAISSFGTAGRYGVMPPRSRCSLPPEGAISSFGTAGRN